MVHTLQLFDYCVAVDTLGAELVRFEKNSLNYLWNKAIPFWQRQAPVLFPIVGKLKNGKYLYQGTEYYLPQHGFARDRDFELVGQTPESLLFRLDDNKHPGYPFEFELYIGYFLSIDGLKVTYMVINKGLVVMPFSIGAHPAFMCPLYPNETLEDYYFEFENDQLLHQTKLVDGLLANEIKLPLTDKKLPVSETLFQDDALVLSEFRSKWIMLKGPKSSIKVSWDYCIYLGLWKQPNSPFVCIEPWWGVTDNQNTSGDILLKRGIEILPSKETKSFTYRIEII